MPNRGRGRGGRGRSRPSARNASRASRRQASESPAVSVREDEASRASSPPSEGEVLSASDVESEIEEPPPQDQLWRTLQQMILAQGRVGRSSFANFRKTFSGEEGQEDLEGFLEALGGFK